MIGVIPDDSLKDRTIATYDDSVLDLSIPRPSYANTEQSDSDIAELEERYNGILEIERINLISLILNEDDTAQLYAEFIVVYGTDYRQIANEILEWTVFEYPLTTFTDLVITLDDRYTALRYEYDTTALGWRVVTLESYNLTRAYVATSTPTPRPIPTQAPQLQNNTSNPSRNTGGNSSNTTRRPDNCADAVSMGLTAQQAAQWDHLDRDNDGVACYGD